MSLSIGIVGLPNVGKSTLFNALLKKQVALAANYPFATIEPNVGVVDVPDYRLNDLAQLVKTEYGSKFGSREVPEKIVPAVVKFVDIAGLVKGASAGEGLGNKFLSHIREVDAIVHVLRDFEDENVLRAGSIDAQSDKEVIETELILADIQSIEKRLAPEQRNAKTGDKESIARVGVYEKLLAFLSKGILAFNIELDEHELEVIKDLNLLTLKPIIYVYNVSENALTKEENDSVSNNVVRLSAKIESELSMLSEEDQALFMKDIGINVSGLDKVIKRGYDLLGLHTFFTAGPKEVRAWTMKKGDKAPQAAGKIHTDFERGFISAEICGFKSLIEVGGWKNAKEKGLMRIEGKSYVMQDGDVVEFRFSV